MSPALRYALTFAVMLAATAGIAALSDWPLYRHHPADMAQVKLSFSHGSDRKAGCRPATAEELAKLPPNMRRPVVCPRDRPSVRIEADLDGRPLLRAEIRAGGIAGDGPARLYRKFSVPAGPHVLDLRLSDTGRAEGFDYTGRMEVALAPAQNFVVDFRPAEGGFVAR